MKTNFMKYIFVVVSILWVAACGKDENLPDETGTEARGTRYANGSIDGYEFLLMNPDSIPVSGTRVVANSPDQTVVDWSMTLPLNGRGDTCRISLQLLNPTTKEYQVTREGEAYCVLRTGDAGQGTLRNYVPHAGNPPMLVIDKTAKMVWKKEGVYYADYRLKGYLTGFLYDVESPDDSICINYLFFRF